MLIGIIRSVPKTVIATLVIVAVRHRKAVRQVRVSATPKQEKQAHVRAIADATWVCANLAQHPDVTTPTRHQAARLRRVAKAQAAMAVTRLVVMEALPMRAVQACPSVAVPPYPRAASPMKTPVLVLAPFVDPKAIVSTTKG